MVNIIRSELYQQLFGKKQLSAFNTETESIEYSMRFPIPDYLNDEWLINAAKPIYEPYIELMRKFYATSFSDLVIDVLPQIKAGWWYKDPKAGWVRCKTPKGDVGYIDFETNSDTPFCGVLISVWRDKPGYRVYYYVATDTTNQHVSVGNFTLLIGHNVVAFDRQFIAEAYEFNTSLRFLDTKALHKLPFGLGEASQEATWRNEIKKPRPAPWAAKSSPSDLQSACKSLLGVELDKTLQKAHKKKWSDIQAQMGDYIRYCFEDCRAGIQLFKQIMLVWREHCPHPFSLYSLIERSCFRLHIDPQYFNQVAKVNQLVNERKTEFENKVRNAYLKMAGYDSLSEFLETVKDKRKLKFTHRSTITPLVLKVHWKGKPLFRRPIGNSKKLFAWGIINDSGVWEVLPGGKDGDRTGNPIGKTHYSQFIIGELTIENPDFTYQELYEYQFMVSMWASYHKRLSGIITKDLVWLPDSCPAGTVTGRVTGSISAVLPNPDTKKAGSEFRLMLQPSPGNRIVKSDMDRQEVIIASVLVDGSNRYSGSTQFCVEALLGDYHQVVADRLGMSDQRRLIKNLNFACMFGAGVRLISDMILQTGGGRYNQRQSMELAQNHQKALKGQRVGGIWQYGVASELFNILDERAKSPDQRTTIFKRKVPNSLNAKYGTVHGTTAANFAIQSVGQELIDIVMIGVRVLSGVLGFSHNPMLLIHDEIAFDVSAADALKLELAMQYSHLLSKVMLYKSAGVLDFPESQLWFKEVTTDICLRKEVTRVITPTFDSDEHFDESLGS